MTRLFFFNLFLLASLGFGQAANAGYFDGQVVNGYTWHKAGYFFKDGYKYYPQYGSYGEVTYNKVKDTTPTLEQRLLDIKQQQVQAEALQKLAGSLGLTTAQVQSAYSSYSGHNNPLYNAALSGQTTLYGNGATAQSATEFLVQSNLNFDANAHQEYTNQTLLQIAKILGTNLEGAQSFASQFAQIATIQTQGAVTIAEKQEGTKQAELFLRALESVQPKDKATFQFNGGAGGAGAPQPGLPNVFAAPIGARGLTVCKACHTAGGASSSEKAVANLNLDAPITPTEFFAAMDALDSGHMPPNSWQQTNGRWTDADSEQVRKELRALIVTN